MPVPYTYKLSQQKPDVENQSGNVKIVDSTKFKASTAIAAAQVTLKPGGLRELHWHPNADEWQYYVKGQGRMTVFTGGGKARTMDFKAGDVGYIQNTLPHYIENTGDDGPGLPRDVQERRLPGHQPDRVDHPPAGHAAQGPPGHRQGDAAQGRPGPPGGRPGLTATRP